MGIEEDRKEYLAFKVDLWASKHKGVHTEQQMAEKLAALLSKGNVMASRALADAKLHAAPDSRMANSIWESGRIFELLRVNSSVED